MTPEMIARARAAAANTGCSLCSCIGGGAAVSDLKADLAAAGFVDIPILVNDRSDAFIKDWKPGSGSEQYVRAALIEARR